MCLCLQFSYWEEEAARNLPTSSSPAGQWVDFVGDATHTKLRDHLANLETKACVEPSAVQLLTVLIGKASELFGSADSDPLWRMAVMVGAAQGSRWRLSTHHALCVAVVPTPPPPAGTHRRP